MASPTQMVVSKGKSNPLIAKCLLKILRELIPPNPTKILYQFSPMEQFNVLDMVLEQRPHELNGALPKKHQFSAIYHHGNELVNHQSDQTLQNVHNRQGLTGALADLVSTMVADMLSENGGSLVAVADTLAPLKIIGTTQTMSRLISEVTTGTSSDEVEEESFATVTLSAGFATRVPYTWEIIELSLAPRLTVKSVVNHREGGEQVTSKSNGE